LGKRGRADRKSTYNVIILKSTIRIRYTVEGKNQRIPREKGTFGGKAKLYGPGTVDHYNFL